MVAEQNNKFYKLFSSAEGRTHQVIEATNGVQALSLALKNPPDTIFLGDSLGASHAGGVRKIRELPGLQNIKVFAIRRRTTVKTASSLRYDGIIPKGLVPESSKNIWSALSSKVPGESRAK